MWPILLTAFLLALAAAWYYEARIFLFLFQKLCFAARKGPALHLDKQRYFPGSALLEAHYPQIREELQQALRQTSSLPRFHEVDAANHKISFDTGPAWKTVVLKAFGGWFPQNSRLFPQTTQLLKDMPEVSCALFSILEPGTRIPPHTGKLNGLLRYHLALAVPASGHCAITVNGEAYTWQEGTGVLLNDTYVHHVTNDSDEYRIVLFLNVRKPAPGAVRLIDSWLMRVVQGSPVFKRALVKGTINVD